MTRQLPLVEPKEIKRFLTRWTDLDPVVQVIFEELKVIYEQGSVQYKKRGKHTKFNLRHPTHPQTNLSEANALHFLVRAGFQVRYIEDETQYSGTDLEYFKDDRWVSVSVKLCSMATNLLTVHRTICEALHDDPSEEVFFVDNIRRSGLLMTMKELRPLLYYMPVSPFARARNILWFDKLPLTRVKFYGEKL